MPSKRLIALSILAALSVAYSNVLCGQTNRGGGPTVFSFNVSGENLFAATDSGVIRSTDNGKNWAATNSGLTDTTIFSIAISGTNLFAGTNGGGVFLSTNKGTSWTPVNNNLEQLTYSHTFEVAAVSGVIIAAGTAAGDGVFRSNDNGNSWQSEGCDLLDKYDVHSLLVRDTTLYVGTSCGGVFLLTKSGTIWRTLNDGLTDSCVVALALIGSSLFAGTGNGLFRWNSTTTSWAPINVGYRFIKDISVCSIAGSGANLYVGTHFGGVFHSKDNGKNWSAINNGLQTGWNGVEIFALALVDGGLFAGTSEGIYRLASQSARWKKVYPP